jgi:hypothetical protein
MTIIKTPNDFFNDANNYNSNGGTYLMSYPHFIDYFNNVKTITFHELTIGINFTYGWMPTIFDYRDNQFTIVLEILNKLKAGIIPNNDELIFLRNHFNNSLVGTSKLMHFIKPDVVPIWDSRVYKYLTDETPHGYRVDNVNNFRQYLGFCNTLILDQRFKQARLNIEAIVGYSMSPMRIADLVMYSS